MEKRLRRLPDWLYFFGLLPGFSLLPPTLAYRLARWQGRRIYWGRPRSLELMAENLAKALVSLEPSERERIMVNFCQVLASEDLDAYFYRKWSEDSLSRYFDFRGTEHLDDALHKGRGALLVTAHVGSPGSALVALGVKGYPVTHVGRLYGGDSGFPPAYLAYSHRKMDWITQKIGRPVIYADVEGKSGSTATALSVLKALRQNVLVSMAMDVPPERTGGFEEICFLGQPARFPVNFVELAMQCGVPLIPYFTVRCARPLWHRHQVTVLPPVPLDGSVTDVLQVCVDRLEAYVREFPEQWFAWDSLTHFWSSRK